MENVFFRTCTFEGDFTNSSKIGIARNPPKKTSEFSIHSGFFVVKYRFRFGSGLAALGLKGFKQIVEHFLTAGIGIAFPFKLDGVDTLESSLLRDFDAFRKVVFHLFAR